MKQEVTGDSTRTEAATRNNASARGLGRSQAQPEAGTEAQDMSPLYQESEVRTYVS